MSFLKVVSMDGSRLVVVVTYSEMECPREVLQKGAFGPYYACMASSSGLLNAHFDELG